LTTDSAEEPKKLREMIKNDFPTSPPATGGDATLAADLITQAALAIKTDDRATRSRVDHQARSSLEHHHADVRVCATAALSRIGTFTASDLGVLLNDESLIVRRRAVEASVALIQAEQGEAALVDGLLRALGDEPSVAEVAAFAVGEFGPDAVHLTEPAVEVLENMASQHADALCRESAIAALGSLHRGRATVVEAMGDKATVRRRAVLALAPFAGTDVDAALDAALQDRDWQVRQAAEDQIEARR
jgi:hypothetical protein